MPTTANGTAKAGSDYTALPATLLTFSPGQTSKKVTVNVSGDTTPEAKPSPLPVLHACALLGCIPQAALYVGDDRRDIDAGRAAGCRTVAVSYGYLGDSGPLPTWGADLIIDEPADLVRWLGAQR